MFCKHCGKEVPEDARFCPVCGKDAVPDITMQTPPVPPRSRIIYLLLAFFFGCLGVHNFYAGRTGAAVAQLAITLLSCTFLAPLVAIWVLIEMLAVTRDGQGLPMSGNGFLLAIILVIAAVFLAAIVGGNLLMSSRNGTIDILSISHQ